MSEKEIMEKEVSAEVAEEVTVEEAVADAVKTEEDVTEETVADAVKTEKKSAEEKKTKAEKAPKPPKKTKAEINREMRAAIASENDSRKDRNRAEKAARREIKAARKEAQVVEKKKSHMSNGWLALMIFGVIALMFVSVWAIEYSQKEASIEAYIEANGGKETYSDMMLSETATMSITAEKNDMTVLVETTSKDEAKIYKGDDGVKQLKFMAAYYLGSIKPDVRGISASAHCAVMLKDKEYTTVDVKWSEVEDILEENGIHLEDLHHDHDHEHEHTDEEATTETE